MFGMIKMLPIMLLLAGAGYAYHTTVVSQKDARIAQLESNNAVLKTNMRLERAFRKVKLKHESDQSKTYKFN